MPTLAADRWPIQGDMQRLPIRWLHGHGGFK
jgi:hypothetical protein